MNKKWILGMTMALLVAAFASPFASSSPDGLERVAKDKGFLEKATSHMSSPIPHYLFPGIKNESVATSVAGVVGAVFTFGVIYGLGKIVVIRNKNNG